jgi:3-Oxoacyl-[acyl-carrier-protein (ACP)] synthase III C terminal
VNIERYGNTSSATIPVALDEVHRAGRLRIGDHVAFAAFGGGATWGAGLVRWTLAAPDPIEPMPTLVGSTTRPATTGGAA